jgi:2-amino-4-hydroxy-6-hydroxymethyldihydropteridine diphosphokinase
MADVYVGVGSNIEAEAHLKLAVAALEARFGAVRCSDVFRSPAFGFSGDDFLNMVAAFATGEDADAVESILCAIEYGDGRERGEQRFAARLLDLDLLLYGAMVDARRRLPRDDVSRYPFVLGPLAELAPELAHPLTGRSMAAEWSRMAAGKPSLQRVGKLAELL